MSWAHAIREVSWKRCFACVPQQSSALCQAAACPSVAASCCLPTFPTASAVNAAIEATMRAPGVWQTTWAYLHSTRDGGSGKAGTLASPAATTAASRDIYNSQGSARHRHGFSGGDEVRGGSAREAEASVDTRSAEVLLSKDRRADRPRRMAGGNVPCVPTQAARGADPRPPGGHSSQTLRRIQNPEP